MIIDKHNQICSENFGAPKLPANCTQNDESFKRFPLMDDVYVVLKILEVRIQYKFPNHYRQYDIWIMHRYKICNIWLSITYTVKYKDKLTLFMFLI